MTDLRWDGKYDAAHKKIAPLKLPLQFQTVEVISESSAQRQKNLFAPNPANQKPWRNRLIWGDKKYVLPSLLPEFAGKINLIYIDPPFDTGADFSFTAQVGNGNEFEKAPNAVELKAYRDTWGRGLDSYLHWFYETATLLRDLLHENGSIYIHLDWHVGHYAKVILDEIFGYENFRNEIIVPRPISKNLQTQFETISSLSWGHDIILLYSKSLSTKYKPVYKQMETTKPEGYWHHFWSNADRPTMRYELIGVTPQNGQWKYNKERALKAVENYKQYLKHADGKSLVVYWEETGKELEFIRLSKTGKVENWFPPSSEKIADTLWSDILSYENQKLYATQKHEELLTRIIEMSSNEGDLVLDCFCGSGTTAAVAEKLTRNWITCDLGRFAIHTARKRLLQIPNVRPFEVLNLGKYERQAWLGGFGESAAEAESKYQAYLEFMMGLYGGERLKGLSWIHGRKQGRLVHIGSVDAPVSLGDVRAVIAEFKKLRGSGKETAPEKAEVDLLGWEFAFEINEMAGQMAAEMGVKIRTFKIPREVLEQKAVEQGDIQFFELAALEVGVKVTKQSVELSLKHFNVPLDEVPMEIQKSVREWSEWIDYWAVDWDFKGDAFHPETQFYRTKKERKLERTATHDYNSSVGSSGSPAGVYKVLIKVIDILGNDTTKLIEVEIK
ncbi:MAG: site-specific DNA-methyltransferase [Rhizobacter sp.]|nr:site-specific DNA-methyltransferase [Chlorobiales bacterium]